MKTITEAEAKEILYRQKKKNWIFNVQFKKVDGSLRHMEVRFNLDRDKIKGEQGSGMSYNPADYDNLIVNDMKIYREEKAKVMNDFCYNPQKSFRTIPLKRLININAEGEIYLVKHEEEV